jgi:hypothetical protein
MTRGRDLIVLVLLVAVVAGCSASGLKAQKDDSWKYVPQAQPDSYDPTPSGYGHIFRVAGILMYPVGRALDYAVRPFYMLGGLAPEWFGLQTDDAQSFHQAHPELVIPRDAPRLYYQP